MNMHTDSMESLQEGRFDDLFAIWFLINTPQEKWNTKHEMFGYRLQFSGLAIVVYRDAEGYKL